MSGTGCSAGRAAGNLGISHLSAAASCAARRHALRAIFLVTEALMGAVLVKLEHVAANPSTARGYTPDGTFSQYVDPARVPGFDRLVGRRKTGAAHTGQAGVDGRNKRGGGTPAGCQRCDCGPGRHALPCPFARRRVCARSRPGRQHFPAAAPVASGDRGRGGRMAGDLRRRHRSARSQRSSVCVGTARNPGRANGCRREATSCFSPRCRSRWFTCCWRTCCGSRWSCAPPSRWRGRSSMLA